jgi:hypothetical protein
MRRANLASANLKGADFTNADLTDAVLTGADLTNAALAGALYNEKTRWPYGFDPQKSGAVLVKEWSKPWRREEIGGVRAVIGDARHRLLGTEAVSG